MHFHLIGLADAAPVHPSEEWRELVAHARVFSGGLRHRELVKDFLPQEHQWINIAPPMEDVFAQYQAQEEIVVFASGDPLFYGFAATIQRLCPQASLSIYPSFNSLQMLAHRLQMPYENMRNISLTGRDWPAFDAALIEGVECIGVLTDKKAHSPALIAQRMLRYGYDNYQAFVGELLGNPQEEKITPCRLEEMVASDYAYPNNLILKRLYVRPRPLGLPDESFSLLDDRSKMITKAPIRLVSLSQLQLHKASVFWDIGFCTGSVSIEAKMQFPHLRVLSFEIREQCRAILEENCRRWGALGIEAHIGDFCQQDCSVLPAPDAIFIGGHGGKLAEILSQCAAVLRPQGCVVFNSVSKASEEAFLQALPAAGLQLSKSLQLSLNDFNSITILQAQKL